MSELTADKSTERYASKAQQKRDRELSDMRFILRFPEGRRFIYRVIHEGKPFKQAHAVDALLAGKREVSIKFFNDLMEAKPEAFLQIEEEHKAEAVSEQHIEQNQIKQDRKGALV